MAEFNDLPADCQRLAAILDCLAEEIAAHADRFGPAAPPAHLAEELKNMGEFVMRARADLLERDAANMALDALAKAIDSLAKLRFDLGAFTAALNLDQHALSIRREQLDSRHPAVATVLRRLARDHFHLGDYISAARFAEEALSIMTETLKDDDPGLLPFLNSVAGAYEQAGRFKESQSCAERALALAQANFGAADRRLVPALQTLNSVYRAAGRLRDAYVTAERALAIQRSTAGEESFEAGRAIGRFAGIVGQIGERPRARQMFGEALEILRKLRPDHIVISEIATILTNLAGLVEPEEALPLYEGALSLRRSASGFDHPETVRVLSHLGLLLCQRGEDARALAIWNECLDLRRRLLGTTHPDVARSLIDIAYPLQRIGHFRQATRALLEALAILALYEMPGVAARANSLLASIVGNASLAAAILFAKLVVNALQAQRSDAALGGDADHAFVATREQSYRQLGNGLIVSGRLPEAQQALAMLKETELFEITLGDMDPRVTRASLTPLELRWADRASQILERMRTQIATYSRGQGNGLTFESHDSHSRLKRAFEHGVAELEHWLESLLDAFKQAESQVGKNTAIAAIDADPVHRHTIPARTVLLQYLLAGDHLTIILTTSDLLRHYDAKFARGEVHHLVYSMRTALQDGSGDFLKSARRLHDILIAPVVADLRAIGARTLALSLDGVLRYLPFAALHDGTQYLLEKFALVLAAGWSTGEAPMRRASDLRACGLGVTRAIGPHSALHGVREELMAVIRTADNAHGVLPGIIRLDEAFTTDALGEALSSRYSVIHIASHFAFRAAQEASSYLLLGDGSKLTLADLARLDFTGVELMVLSACDTATGGGHGQSGREIEGLGALARHQGARSVIATLWPVRDFATALIMRRFYQSYFQRGLEPPEALRQAQLSIRSAAIGEGTVGLGPARGFVGSEDCEYPSRWDHPRYWAPYLLIGEPWAVLPRP